MKNSALSRLFLALTLCAACMSCTTTSLAQPYLDNETIYRNPDPNNETRRSDHFRLIWGHYNRDGAGISEEMAQGNLQMFEHLWQRNIVELGLNDMGESAMLEKRDGNKYRTNFHFLMTWNDGGGGGAYMSMDANGYSYAMANPGYCRYDPPSGATPHEVGHAWEGQARGFNGSDSSGFWWECTANWFQLQLLNGYPGPAGLIWNSMYYPCHGRDYYDTWQIWEAAREDPRYGAAWVNRVWTDATSDQQAHEFIIDRMLRVSNNTGESDNASAVKDLWGDMAKKCVSWDYERQRWFASANSAEDGSDWQWYQRCRTPLVRMPGAAGWYRPERSHTPMEYGFNIIPLGASANTTVSCDFQPACDPVRQSDWRACLVTVSNTNEARYSCLWSKGRNSITLAPDESKLYLVVIAVPKPMKIGGWDAYLTDAGLQFPYAVSFENAAPRDVVWPIPTGVTWRTFTNADGTKCTHIQSTATVDSTCYVSPSAMVLNSAQVRNYSRIEDYAVVRNSAQVRDCAVVSGHAVVQDTAQVYGNAKVRDWARVFGNARVYDNGRVLEHANVGDTGSVVRESAACKGTLYLYSPSDLTGCIIMEGDSANGNGTSVVADHGVHFGWQWGQNTGIFAQLVDNGYVWTQHDFERDNPVFAMDKYGINQGFLINGARAATVGDRGGRVLPLDGVSQYVELHNTVSDFRETAISVWVKWTGTGTDQRIWSMGDGANKVMYVTPADDNTGALRFVISNGTTTQTLNGASALPANTWTHVAVTFGSPIFNTTTRTWSVTGTLYVNGAQVATQAGMLAPDSLNAPLMENANYIGRGNAGNYFQGCVDDFRVYMKTLAASDIATLYSTAAPGPVTIAADSTAPTPNAATWLSVPKAISDTSVTMSATPGTDESNWVEYYFTCTSGGGHDSGWVSFNKYTDVGLTPGSAYTYTVAMRDKNGNTTTASTPAGATTQVSSMSGVTASFAYGPVGKSNSQITMTATKLTSPSGLVQYKFDRVSPTLATSGWKATPSWTDTGLVTGTRYYYKVTAKDGRGNISITSASASSTANDLAAPSLPSLAAAHWQMMPYATVDNRVSMTATPAQEAGAQVYYECVSGGGPSSGWIPATSTDDGGSSYYAKWTAPNELPDGTYAYRYKVKDTAGNESPYSVAYSARITPTTGYHASTVAQCLTLQDDYLVKFMGTVVKIYPNYYIVTDFTSGASIEVRPNNGLNDGLNHEVTDPNVGLKNVLVKGHLYTFSGKRVVTYSTVTATGEPALYTISGKVADTNGIGIAGAKVYFSDASDPSSSPIVTATTDSAGNYSRGVINGTWYVAAGASAYNTSADRVVPVSGTSVTGVNFTLVANSVVSGKVIDKFRATPIGGASIFFSRSPGAAADPVFTAVSDSSGNYSQPLQNGIWYVAASADGYILSGDTTVTVNGANIADVKLPLTPKATAIFVQKDTATQGTWINASNGTRYYGKDGYEMGGVPTSTPSFVSSIDISECNAHTWRGASTGNPARDLQIPAAPYTSRIASGWYTNSGTITIRISDNAPHLLAVYCEDPDSTSRRQTLEILEAGTDAVLDSRALDTQFDQGVWLQWKVTGSVKIRLTADAGANAAVMGVFFDPDSALTYHTITASAGAGGTITPNGSISAADGFSKLFTLTPNFGYAVADVVVDGVSQGAAASYTFTNVTTDHAISASFSEVPRVHLSGKVTVGGVTTNSGTVNIYTDSACTSRFAVADVTSTGDYSVLVPQASTYYLKAAKTGYAPSAALTAVVAGSDLPGQNLNITARRYEAEDAVLAGCGIVNDVNASGSKRVAAQQYGGNNTVTFAVYADAKDDVEMTMGYYQPWDGNRDTLVTVNGVPLPNIPAPGVASPKYGTSTATIPLNAGTNTVVFSNGTAWGPHWDYIDVPLPDASTYTITASAGPNGSISPFGNISVPSGADQDFVVAPNPGFLVYDVVVDGVSQWALRNYTFQNVLAGHQISAAFAKPVGMNNESLLTDAIVGRRAVVVWGKVASVGQGTFQLTDGYRTNITVIGPTTGLNTTMNAVVSGIINADRSVTAQAIKIF